MAVLLNDCPEILFFHPKVPEGYFVGRYEKQAVLLPMRLCKVMVPYPVRDTLNLFQETILKLLNCGAKEEGWLAKKLALDRSLVEVVIKELCARDLITSTRNITEKGIKFLQEEELSYDLRTGYIFYDYSSGTYMDAFLPDDGLNYSEVRSRDRAAGIVQLSLDGANPNSRGEAAVQVEVRRPETEIIPTAKDILRACKRQKKREGALFAGDRMEPWERGKGPWDAEKVSLLNCKEVFVVTYLVIPTSDIANKSRMQVLYPFGEGFSPQLMEPLLACADRQENEPLKKAIEELKKRQTYMTENEKRSARRYNEEVVKRVDAVFSERIQDYPFVYRRVLELENKREFIFRLMQENKGKNWETIQSGINDYILAIYRFTGAALIEAAEKNDYYTDILNGDQGHNADTLTELALQCGFRDEDVFGRYFRIKKGRVTGGGGIEEAKTSEEVCALIALNLLETRDNPSHPFYRLAKENPGFIVEAAGLTRLRDDGMHGNDIEYNLKQVEGLGRTFLKSVSSLLDGLAFDEKSLALGEARMVDETVLRHRKEAENRVEKLFTGNINRYAGLKNKLVDLIEEQGYGEEYLGDSEKDGLARTGESYPTYVAEVLEFLLKELCRHRLEKKALAGLENYSEEYGNRILYGMQAAGFLVKRIPYYNFLNISKAFHNYKMGTMQANFYAWYFSELEQPDNLLSELAGISPDFIQLISDAVEVRRHKGLQEYHSPSLDFIKKGLNDCVNGVVDFMVYRGLY